MTVPVYGGPDMGIGIGKKFHSHIWRPSLQYVCVWFTGGKFEIGMFCQLWLNDVNTHCVLCMCERGKLSIATLGMKEQKPSK